MTVKQRMALAKLRSAGIRMANLCFNLSQSPTNPYAKEMKELYREWDAANNEEIREMQRKPARKPRKA